MTKPLRILIVDDDAADRKLVKRRLANTGLEVFTHETSSAEECLKILQLSTVDCILLDYRLPEMNGIDFLIKLRDSGKTGWPAIVMMTGSGNERLVVQAMRHGVQDYLVKDEITPENLEQAILHAIESTRLREAEQAESRRIEELALVDSLTRVGNRNFFNIRLDHALNRARRQTESIGLLYMDLNGFKTINDSRGHAAGDQVLREVARRLMETARDADTVVRLGGDEFAVIMETGVSQSGAQILADRIEDALSRPIAVNDAIVSIGVSVGIAHFPEDGDSADELLHAADSAMYLKKSRLRDDAPNAAPAPEPAPIGRQFSEH